MTPDPALLRRAALLATGADVHRVNGLCHAYRLLCGAAGRGDAAAIGQARERGAEVAGVGEEAKGAGVKAYYEQDGVTIFCGDALEVMAELPEQSIDSVITDPPYCAGAISEAQRTREKGQGLRSETCRRLGWFVGDNMGTAGLAWILRSVAVASRRIVKTSGSMITFCDWRMLSALQPAIESAGLRYQNLIVWDKEHMGLGTGFRCQHELAMHFTYGDPEYHDKGTPNVLKCRRVDRDEREHQTQKPTDLMGRLVRVVCPMGGTVLDPFGGSGSTALAARDNGRKCILIEHDQEHCETAANRLRQNVLFGVAS